ncbi:DUF502 domain-containing protein [Novipirellula artificiosorum]|uniref:DUF502 domain-containing protein n=1 Tax=Novipirellula artificiosorum TaxID=2528016 RepID=A0A5C6E193_9BACT|nr:DUF502 domain-containing protein [Novipirellula artificiosorum]TWU42662.1 hypothetical protein Poly41_09610 [Novipirellula artificiosorum]
MRENITKTVSFLRATAIGGVFFLLPLGVVLGLLGYIYNLVIAVAAPLHDALPSWLPLNTPVGIAFLFSLSVTILVLLCFASGIAARRAIGRRFSQTLEKQLTTVFPKYAIYKDLLAGNLKHDRIGPSLKPVLVSSVDGYRLAFEADRLENGLVVIYAPGAPDTWIGAVTLVPHDRVFPTEIDFNETLGIFERLGRDSRVILASVKFPDPQGGPIVGVVPEPQTE